MIIYPDCCTWQNLGGVKMIYTFSDPAPNGAVTISFSMVGPNMSMFRKYRCFCVRARARACTPPPAPLHVHSTLVET